jgi:cytochrome c5
MKHLEGIKLLACRCLWRRWRLERLWPLGRRIARNRSPTNKTVTQDSSNEEGQDRGQQVFEQNCARCHNAPEGFSSSISGTVAMHMRVRAGLSDADYKALRRFLNP